MLSIVRAKSSISVGAFSSLAVDDGADVVEVVVVGGDGLEGGCVDCDWLPATELLSTSSSSSGKSRSLPSGCLATRLKWPYACVRICPPEQKISYSLCSPALNLPITDLNH